MVYRVRNSWDYFEARWAIESRNETAAVPVHHEPCGLNLDRLEILTRVTEGHARIRGLRTLYRIIEWRGLDA